jgi:integrase
MPLTATAVKNAKAVAKPLKLFDSGGLYLLVRPNGSRWWRFKYRIRGREKLLSLGVYPDVSLALARDRRDDARRQTASGVDPADVRKASKAANADRALNSFECVAREWLAKQAAKWALGHGDKISRRFERDVYPWLGSKPISDISAADLLSTLRRIEARGAIETAHRALQNCGQVFRYAVATGRSHTDPTGALRGALTPVVARHFASITEPRAVGELLRAIQGYRGSFVTKCALKLAPLVFVRPGELRKAEWREFDLDAAQWRIPAERMKARDPHVVPLSEQALACLRELQPLTGAGAYVFPGARTVKRPMSENTVLSALRRLGYSRDEMTGHGFRSMASTMLNEQGWHRDAIERQLAHSERNHVRAAYNYAEHLPERIRMMQAWADYLDSLIPGARITQIRRSVA